MTGDDHARVTELLGRAPQGRYEVVVRDAAGDPIVVRNAPLLDDGTPMPTRYWLIGADENRWIGRLEAGGGVNAAEAAVDAEELAAAHARYAAERDAEIPPGHAGPRPSGGVGGTRVGVKCLHAHWAWYLAGGDDPVGRWIAARLGSDPHPSPDSNPSPSRGSDPGVQPTLTIDAERIAVALPSGATAEVPWGPRNLTAAWLAEHDPPWAADLTNAIGTIVDHFDDVAREHPEWERLRDVTIAGPAATALARLEIGSDDVEPAVELTRRAAEEVFRLVATERTADRASNPGLPSHHVESIVATCVIVVAVMRHRDLDSVALLSRAPV